MCSAESPPKLMLNDHCQVCEFRQRCHAQAVKEDNLSLLRGLGEKEIITLGKKGIFTVTQARSHISTTTKEKKNNTDNNERTSPCKH